MARTRARASAPSSRARPAVGELSWPALNDYLRDATEDECAELIREEKAGRNRPLVLNRIVCRYLRMHSQRLRRELMSS